MNKINNIFSNPPSSHQKNFSFSQGKKRFLKKQILLETILFQYMEWRELIEPKSNLKQTSQFSGAFPQLSKSRILKDFQTNGRANVPFFQPGKNRNANMYANLHLPTSASYWLFPLLGLVLKSNLNFSGSKPENFIASSDAPKTALVVQKKYDKSTTNTSSPLSLSSLSTLDPNEILTAEFLKTGNLSINWANLTDKVSLPSEQISIAKNSSLLRKLDPMVKQFFENQPTLQLPPTDQPIQSYIQSGLLYDETLPSYKLNQNSPSEINNFHKFLTEWELIQHQLPIEAIKLQDSSLTPSIFSQKFIKILTQAQPETREVFSPTTWKMSLKSKLDEQLKFLSIEKVSEISLKPNPDGIVDLTTPLFGSNQILDFEKMQGKNQPIRNTDQVFSVQNIYGETSFDKTAPHTRQSFQELHSAREISELAVLRQNLKQSILQAGKTVRKASKENFLILNKKLDEIVSQARENLLKLLFENWNSDFNMSLLVDLKSQKNSNFQQNFGNAKFKSRNIEKILRSYLSVKKRDTQLFSSSPLFKDSKNLQLKSYIDLLKVDLKSKQLISTKTKRTLSTKVKEKRKFSPVAPSTFLNKNGLIFLRSEKVRELKLKHLNTNSLSTSQTNKDDSNIIGGSPIQDSLFIKQARELSRLEKLKLQQKHRRRKKLRRETRRRKKRKRIYPRPLWIRFKFYQKFLTLRHSPRALSSTDKLQIPTKNWEKIQKKDSASLAFTSSLRPKLYRTNKMFSSPFVEKLALKNRNSFNSIPVFSENRFYYIPKFVLSEFQRLVIKSYWLKANLNPYLNRIQNAFTQIRTQQKTMGAKAESSLQNFLLNIFNFSSSSSPSQVNYTNFYRKEIITTPNLFGETLKDSFYEQSSLAKKLTTISEYNNVLSQRILYLIKNIKANLAGNGNLRTRPYHSGRKRQEKVESKNVWNLFNQIVNFEFFANLTPKAKIENQYRLYWALNKTNVFGFKEKNAYENIWNFSKYRDQKKSNQTKKILNKFKRVLTFAQDSRTPLELNKLQNVEQKLATLVSPKEKASLFKNGLFKNGVFKNQTFKLNTPKRRLFFWWNCLPINNIFQTTAPIASQNTWQDSPNSSKGSFVESNFVNFCLISVHFAIMFSVLQISQVRSLLKVVFLVATKFVNAYCSLLNWTLQRYQITQKKYKLVGDAFKGTSFNQSRPKNAAGTKLEIEEKGISLTNKKMDKLIYEGFKNQKSLFTSSRYLAKTKFWLEIGVADSQSNDGIMLQTSSRNGDKQNLPLLPQSISATLNWRLFALINGTVTTVYSIQKFSYQVSTKVIESFEGFLAFIYQFLEKPAEFMIDWIGQLFLIEWSAHISSYLPENLETNIWKTFLKISRQSYVFGLPGFLLQRRFFSTSETFLNLIIKSETDLIMRQKKSQIFWEIWSEILVRAVSKYNMNLSSLTTIKDEQDRLFENLFQDPKWDWSNSSLQKLTPYFEFKNLQSIQHWFIENETTVGIFISPMLIPPRSKFSDTSKPSVMPKIWQGFSKQPQNNFFEPTSGSELFRFSRGKEWNLYQSATLQARESDLFLEYSPPTGFKSTRALNNAASLQQNLGNVICEIYSNILTKKISKNILVIGPPGREKTLLIQALAGETELKIMTDNAHRYAIVQRGVAIGMKLLRDVFEGLALNAPCIFLIEDIHVIGEKRSFLISEDQITSTDTSLGAERDEIHERNQMIAQITRHMMTHYKKPYKGDFSMSIPANRFNFQLFLGVTPPLTRRANLTIDNPLDFKEIQEKSVTGVQTNSSNTGKSTKQRLLSILQLPRQEKFAPPTTSPFSLLILREQKKFKPKKRVRELPWFTNTSQTADGNLKAEYSVRVKVAMLADLAISNLSAKLDMITELLVIIDSVRSNHGFLVFATTHLPYKLDPALRRPGRLDETLNLALQPSLKDRLEMIKLNFSDHSFVNVTNFDQFRGQQQFETNLLFQTSLLNGIFKNSLTRTFNTLDYAVLFESRSEFEIQQVFLTAKTENARRLILNKQLPASRAHLNKGGLENEIENLVRFDLNQLFGLTKRNKLKISENFEKVGENQLSSTFQAQAETLEKAYSYLRSGALNLQALIYSRTAELIIGLDLQRNMKTYTLQMVGLSNTSNNFNNSYTTLYAPTKIVNEEISRRFANNIGQFLIFSSFKPTPIEQGEKAKSKLSFNGKGKGIFTNLLISNHLPPFHLIGQFAFNNGEKVTMNTSAQGFLLTVNEKRRIHNQYSLIFDFLSFTESATLKEPPGPSVTSILKPLKKYENLQRTHEDYEVKPQMTIQEKIQLHQQQRFLKALYQKPIQQLFKNLSSSNSGSTNSMGSSFNNSLRDLGYYDNLLFKPSSINIYYRNRILNRHCYYYTNQWWTGQLPEHTIEVTFASDVDWRSRFIESKGEKPSQHNGVSKIDKISLIPSKIQDITIDFPDPDQYYNPRLRRWILTNGVWANWNTIANWKTGKSSQFSSNLLMQYFQKTYTSLSFYREKLDYLSYLFLRYGKIHELDFLAL